MNLLQCAPLCDSRGKVRYFIGAQIDVSGLAMESAQMESLQNIQAQKENPSTNRSTTKESKSEFQELGELFSPSEPQNVRDTEATYFNRSSTKIRIIDSSCKIPIPRPRAAPKINRHPSQIPHQPQLLVFPWPVSTNTYVPIPPRRLVSR
jgi:hypothetical protein